MYYIVLTRPAGDCDLPGCFMGPGPGPASSALRCSPTPGQHTSTAGTRPPGFLCQEAQVHRARNRTPLKDRDVDKEDEEDGVQHEDEQDDVTVERLMKNNMI